MAKCKSVKKVEDDPTFEEVQKWYDEHLHPDELCETKEVVFVNVYDEQRFPAIFQFTSCLTSDSNILLSNGTEVSIADVSVGDSVKSYDENTRTFIDKIVQNTYNNGLRECIEITMINGRSITCTNDHLMLTSNRGWVQATDLTEEDEMVEFQ